MSKIWVALTLNLTLTLTVSKALTIRFAVHYAKTKAKGCWCPNPKLNPQTNFKTDPITEFKVLACPNPTPKNQPTTKLNSKFSGVLILTLKAKYSSTLTQTLTFILTLILIVTLKPNIIVTYT